MARAASSSPAAPPTARPPRHPLASARGLVPLLVFGCSVILLALVLSAPAALVIDLPLWKIFRRCVSLAAAASLWICIVRLEGRRFSDYGFDLASRAGKREVWVGMGAGLAAFAVLLALGFATGACHLDLHDDTAKVWRTLLLFVPGALLVAVLEELVFRGYLLRHAERYGWLTAWLGTSALYAVVHLKTTALSPQLWMELTGLMIFGMVLAGLARASGRLSLAIGLHAVLAYGARVNKLVIAIPDSSWTWLTGTSRLVNGVAGWVVIVILGGMLLAWVRRNKQQEA